MSDASSKRTTSPANPAGGGGSDRSGVWRRCSACKADIALGALHYVCSVSTCNRKRTALVFCSVDCWEIHLPTERHREAWAVEARAPKTPEPAVEPTPSRPRSKKPRASKAPDTSAAAPPASSSTPAAPIRPSTIIRRASSAGAEEGSSTPGATRPSAIARAASSAAPGDEILVVASRLKNYVKSVSGFNTSDRALPILSAALRVICDEAIENARRAERLTVLDRDVPRD